MFRDAYAWMMRQMDALPDADVASSGTPVWVWPTRVDLRSHIPSMGQRPTHGAADIGDAVRPGSSFRLRRVALCSQLLVFGGERASDCFHRWTERVCNTDVYRSKPLPLIERIVWSNVPGGACLNWKRLRTRLEYVDVAAIRAGHALEAEAGGCGGRGGVRNGAAENRVAVTPNTAYPNSVRAVPVRDDDAADRCWTNADSVGGVQSSVDNTALAYV